MIAEAALPRLGTMGHSPIGDTMTREEILAFINRNNIGSLATVDGTTPKVRGINLYAADSRGLIFHTGSMKPLYGELLANPKAEYCFWDPSSFVQVRIRGEFHEETSRTLKEEIVAHPSRAFLKPWMAESGREAFFDLLKVFRMREGEALVWTFATNFEPHKPIRI